MHLFAFHFQKYVIYVPRRVYVYVYVYMWTESNLTRTVNFDNKHNVHLQHA